MKTFFSTLSICTLAILLMAAGCKNTQETTTEAQVTETEIVETSTATTGTEGSKEQVKSDVENGPDGGLDKGMAVAPAGQLVSLKRTPCFGRCPMYRVTIMDNGELVYEGKRFVEKIGTYSGLITGQDVENIIKKINEVKYFEMEDAYDVPIADFPTCVTTVNLDGKSKSIMNKQGAPGELKQFELYIDSLLEGLELKKVSDEVTY
jgi:hypothetical protein